MVVRSGLKLATGCVVLRPLRRVSVVGQGQLLT